MEKVIIRTRLRYDTDFGRSDKEFNINMINMLKALIEKQTACKMR